MSEYSVADTKNRLSELLDRAEKGEDVVVTRHGKPVAKITPVRATPAKKKMTAADIARWDRNRVTLKKPGFSVVELMNRMRDEDWR